MEKRQELVASLGSALSSRDVRALVISQPVSEEFRLHPGIDYHFFSESENSSSTLLHLAAASLHFYDIVLICSTVTPPIETVTMKDRGSGDFRGNFQGEWEGVSDLAERVFTWLGQLIAASPVWGCLLIGGRSSRMGRPKHLIAGDGGKTWLENQLIRFGGVTENRVISGRGELPASLQNHTRISDVTGGEGPLVGIVGAMRWNPDVSWIVAACDMPHIQERDLQWLLDQRRPGIWGVVPLHPETGKAEPLFAWYDFRAKTLFDLLLRSKNHRLSGICNNPQIATPLLPREISHGWSNCNYPEDIPSPS